MKEDGRERTLTNGRMVNRRKKTKRDKKLRGVTDKSLKGAGKKLETII